MRAGELMSTPVVTIYPEASLKELAELMVAHSVSGVPVVDRAGTLLGVVSESDVVAKIEGALDKETELGLPRLITAVAKALHGSSKATARSVADLMTARVISAGPDATVPELVHLMIAYDINRIHDRRGRTAARYRDPGGRFADVRASRCRHRNGPALAHRARTVDQSRGIEDLLPQRRRDARRHRGHACRRRTGSAMGRQNRRGRGRGGP